VAPQTPLAGDSNVPPEAEGGPPPIVSLGGGRYRVGRFDPIKVTQREDWVLTAFVRKSPLTKGELADLIAEIEPEDAVGVLRSLKGTKKRVAKYNGLFANAIRLPGKRGAGGYHVNVRRAD
jgi:hypothetical protein